MIWYVKKKQKKSWTHCESLNSKSCQTLGDCCVMAYMNPHSVLGMEHSYRMSHLARSNLDQHGSYYPHHSLECTGITSLPPAPPLWQHTRKKKNATVWIFIPRSVFPIRTALLLSLPHLMKLRGKWNCGFNHLKQSCLQSQHLSWSTEKENPKQHWCNNWDLMWWKE